MNWYVVMDESARLEVLPWSRCYPIYHERLGPFRSEQEAIDFALYAALAFEEALEKARA